MSKTYQYTRFLPSVIQGLALSKCKRHRSTNRSLTVYRKNGHLIYEAYWRRYIMTYLARDTFNKTNLDKKEFETFCYIIENDLDRVITDAAVYSWLCTDGTSIRDKIEGDIAIPKTLYSGLVLRYYEPTLRICAFNAELSYIEEMANLSDDVIKSADDYAWLCLEDKLPSIGISREKAQALVRKHIHNRSQALERV